MPINKKTTIERKIQKINRLVTCRNAAFIEIFMEYPFLDIPMFQHNFYQILTFNGTFHKTS